VIWNISYTEYKKDKRYRKKIRNRKNIIRQKRIKYLEKLGLINFHLNGKKHEYK